MNGLQAIKVLSHEYEIYLSLKHVNKKKEKKKKVLPKKVQAGLCSLQSHAGFC